ncbi:hypothetical protein SBA3_1820010 [Candidatus Sulfopaludibacter sp. SbA3]|nr:hypothetical protein SBA3_1820010 [Candidatus Sulfopaludibacter sp. SbA3]
MGIMNGDGQASVAEAAAMGGELEAGFALLPAPVVDFFGFALYLAQDGGTAGSTSRLNLSAASVPPACWKLSRIGIGARIEPSTPYGSRVRYSCCISSKGNPSAEQLRQKPIWI